MSAIASASSQLFSTLSALTGVAVTFRRGTASVPVTATPGKSLLASDDSVPERIEVQSHDWIVRAADLVLGGKIVTPRKGDLIIRTLAGQTFTYELMSEPFSPSDTTGIMLRLHSKLVKTA